MTIHKKKTIFSLLCCFLLMAVTSYPPLCVASVERPLDRGGDEATFVVVDADTPAAIIVIAEDADEPLMALADELRHYLEAISGKAFQITNVVSDGRSILLGTSEQVSLLAYPEIVKQLNANPILSKEAFVIKPEKNRLLLVGNTSLGVSHAVFTLLEELGCRWFFPGKTWEIIPHKNTLQVTTTVCDEPKIPSRRIWYQWGFIHDEGKGYQRSVKDFELWQRHNRMATSFNTHVGHVWQNVYTAYKDEFDAHPEYFLWNTAEKRYETAAFNHGIKIDTFHSGVENIFKAYVLDAFRKNPNADMIGTGPSDGYVYGLVSKTNPDATASDIAFHGTQTAAVAIKAAAITNALFRNKYVGQYAYADYSDPPSFPLEDNVYIELTSGFIDGTNSYAELLDIWPKLVRQMGFYSYYSVFQWNHDTLPGGDGANTVHRRQEIPSLYHQQHAVAISAESGNNWGLHGRGYYLASKLMWNPDADADVILNDFYQYAFGPAAEIMKQYYELFDPGENPFMSRYLLGKGAKLIHEAAVLTKSNPEISARIDDMKVFWKYVELRHHYDTTKDEGAKRQIAKAICTHAYRSRFRYMNHWEAIRQQWLGGGGLKIPEWQAVDTAPWKGIPDYTKPEIEVLFDEVRTYFPSQDIDVAHFSSNLVPIQWSTLDKRVIPQEGGIWQGGHLIWMYSFGEPIELTIMPNLTGPKKPLVCTLIDRSGKTIEEQRRGSEEVKCKFLFNVPKPGLYQVSVNNGFWRISDYSMATPMLIPTKTKYIHHGWQTPTCFYVPKGIDEIRLIGYFSNDCDLYTDTHTHVTGKALASKNGDVQIIPVPEGEDGKVWSFHNVLINQIWFLNVPNYLGYSPASMMVPEEVAQKDGLTIRTTYGDESL